MDGFKFEEQKRVIYLCILRLRFGAYTITDFFVFVYVENAA